MFGGSALFLLRETIDLPSACGKAGWFSRVRNMSGLQFAETCQVSGGYLSERFWKWGQVSCPLLSKSFYSFSICRGSPPTTSTSSSSLTNDVTKQPVSRDITSVRPANVGNMGVQYTPHSHQFPRTRKMFDKGPEQVKRVSFQFCFLTPLGSILCVLFLHTFSPSF